MIQKEKNGIEWLEFEIFQSFPEIIHGTFLRKGGISPLPKNDLNMVIGKIDIEENVLHNIKKAITERELTKYFKPIIVHGDKIIHYKKDMRSLNYEGDAVISDVKNVAFLTTHADCQVALFYDPKNKVVANVHCGWRGNVCNIYAKTISLFKKDFGSNPKDIFVGITPSLGPDSFEFKDYKILLPKEFWSFTIKPNHFDFWEISQSQLLKAGIQKNHLEIARICNKSDPSKFFSYRGQKVTGRHGTIIAIK